MPLRPEPDQGAEDGCRRLGVAESGVGRLQVQLQLGHQADERRRLPGGQLEQCPAERRRVDDRVLERPPQAARDEPAVEGVVAVLDQHAALRELEEAEPGLAELGSAGKHAALDLVALSRVGIDGCARVDQGVEESQRAVEAEALGPDLEDEEGPVAGGLDVEGGVLGLVEGRLENDGGQVDVVGRQPLDSFGRSARLDSQ